MIKINKVLTDKELQSKYKIDSLEMQICKRYVEYDGEGNCIIAFIRNENDPTRFTECTTLVQKEVEKRKMLEVENRRKRQALFGSIYGKDYPHPKRD